MRQPEGRATVPAASSFKYRVRSDLFDRRALRQFRTFVSRTRCGPGRPNTGEIMIDNKNSEIRGVDGR